MAPPMRKKPHTLPNSSPSCSLSPSSPPPSSDSTKQLDYSSRSSHSIGSSSPSTSPSTSPTPSDSEGIGIETSVSNIFLRLHLEAEARRRRGVQEISNNEASSSFPCKPPATPLLKDNKPYTARKALPSLSEIEENFFIDPPFEDLCFKAAELEAENRYPDSARNEDEVRKDVCRSVEEEIRMQKQAKRASILAKSTALRLSPRTSGSSNFFELCFGGVAPRTSGSSNFFQSELSFGGEKRELKISGRLLDFVTDPEKKSSRPKDHGCDKKIRMPVIVKLTGVTIFPKVHGHGESGTLEAHSDRFIYTTSSSHFNSKLTFEYENVKDVFVQAKGEVKMPKMPLLLHFRLHHPMKVGTEITEHIQFRPVPMHKRRRSDNVSEFEKEKSKDLKDFRDKVEKKWSGSFPPFTFSAVSKQYEFHGVLPSKKVSDFFVLNQVSLLQLTDTPFCVVNLEEFEIVNLARLRPREIDMTIVYKDFNRSVLQIRAIPIESLEGLKKRFHLMNVKYYDNNVNPNWDFIVRKIANNQEAFIREGGWEAYQLEDMLVYS